MKLPFPAVILAIGAALAVSTGCASEAALGIPRVAMGTTGPSADSPPMCVALKGPVTSTTEVTSVVTATRLEAAPAAAPTEKKSKASSSTVKDRGALVFAKGT